VGRGGGKKKREETYFLSPVIIQNSRKGRPSAVAGEPVGGFSVENHWKASQKMTKKRKEGATQGLLFVFVASSARGGGEMYKRDQHARACP